MLVESATRNGLTGRLLPEDFQLKVDRPPAIAPASIRPIL